MVVGLDGDFITTMGRDEAVPSPKHQRCSDDEDSAATSPPISSRVSLRSLPHLPLDQVDALSVGGDRRCSWTPLLPFPQKLPHRAHFFPVPGGGGLFQNARLVCIIFLVGGRGG